jgi:hypothetical protein
MAKPKDQMNDMGAPALHLDHETLKQFGLHKGKLPKVGDKLPLMATAHVKGVGETEGGRHLSVELHDMTVGKGKKLLKPDGDSEQMNKGMKHAVDKAVVGPKEGGSEDADGDEA